MKYYQKADRVIADLIKRGNKKFIIFPFGERAHLVKSILNDRYGIQEAFIVDNKLAKMSYNQKIISLADLKNVDISDAIVLLASNNNGIYSEIRYQLMKYVALERIVDVFSASMYFDKETYYDKPYSEYPRTCALEMASREIYKNGVKGAIAECGVYRGDFANHMSRLMPDRRLYLFDTFSGFDKRDIDDAEKELSCNFLSKTNLDDTSVTIALNNIGYRANAIVRQGYFPDTAIGLEDERFAFVSLDTDLYKPILAGLEFFYPRLSPGGYIFVDDMGHKDLLGVRKAVMEFCEKEKIGYVNIFDGIDSSAIIVKSLWE